ncbi:MAG: TIGR04150 pseudo-rSAM protein [Marinifilaceae bacterium]
MKTYWLYLESYTFAFANTREVLIVNTLSSQTILFPLTLSLKAVITELLAPQNNYAIQITEEQLKDSSVNSFVSNVRESFSGDLIDQAETMFKPVILKPQLNLQRDISKLKREDFRSVGENIKSYLSELSIYVTGQCSRNCTDCKSKHKQINWCTKNEESLSLEKISKFCDQINGTQISTINFLGGDLLNYQKLPELIEITKLLNPIKRFHVHYQNISKATDKLAILNQPQHELNVLVDFPLQPVELEQTIDYLKSTHLTHKWEFAIANEDEYDQLEKIIDSHQLSDVKIKPFFDGSNLDFFRENIFMSREDLHQQEISRKEIFAHQSLNTNHFGKLIITSDGKVFANLNHSQIGIIDESIREILFKEMNEGTSWLKTRNTAPCSSCVYQWLCPSPSNYEEAIKKPNLCTLDL